MRITELLLAASLLAAFCPAPLGAQYSDWVPYEVITPIATHPDTRLNWSRPWLASDIDRDGYADFYLNGTQWSPTYSVPNPITRLYRGGALDYMERWNTYKGTATFAQPEGNVSFLRWPGQYVAAFVRLYRVGWSYTDAMEVWSLTPWSYIATVALPPPPSPALPALESWGWPSPAGDVDGDGFDDFGFATLARDTFRIPPLEYGVFGLIDGATLQARWLRYWQGDQRSVSAVGPTTGRRQDLDGDGWLDFVLVDARVNENDWRLEAVSGRDGHTIWEVQDPPKGWLDRFFVKVPDMDGDGLDDVFVWQPHLNYNGVHHPGKLVVLSARDGSIIWLTPLGYFDPSFNDPNADKGIYFQPSNGWAGDVDRDGKPELYEVAREYDLHPTVFREFRVWLFSGKDGALLRRETLAPDLSPWFPGDPVQDELAARGFRCLGDVNGDGYGEMWATVFANDFEVNGGRGEHCVILGRRTLTAPAQALANERIRLDLDIPAGPGRDFRLLLSTAFEPLDTGVMVGRWKTHLAATKLYQLTASDPSLRGILDGQGRGHLWIRIPQGLRGETVYARAIIENPARPDGVLTMSSVAEITIL